MPIYEVIRQVVASDLINAVGQIGNVTSVRYLAPDANGQEPRAPETAKATPAQIRASVQPDYLVSFEDGRQYKTLKRHLHTHGLTPAAYREKWGLPADYPLTAASYSARRSALAKANGLGKQ